MKRIFLIGIGVVLSLLIVGSAGLYFVGDKIIDIALNSQIQEIDQSIDASINKSIEQGLDLSQGKDVDQKDKASDATPSQTVSSSMVGMDKEHSDAKGDPSAINNDAVKGNPSTVNKDTNKNAIPDKKETVNAPKTNEVAVDVNLIKKVKDTVSATDKISIAALVVTRLSSHDINNLTGLISGGITQAEKEEAKKIAYERFGDKDIEKIKQYYTKYLEENSGLFY